MPATRTGLKPRAPVRLTLAAFAAGVAFLAAPCAAHADRDATKRERASILRGLRATSGFDIRPCEIGQVRVSTIDRRWAVFAFGYAPGYTTRTCLAVPTGRIVARRVHGRWRQSAIGSDFDCSDRGLPAVRIQRDLGVRCSTQQPAP